MPAQPAPLFEPIARQRARPQPLANPLDAFRLLAGQAGRLQAWRQQWADRRAAVGSAVLTTLALSCGGANGAFGAGVMLGWSRSGRPPTFDVVTGVSAGALIAPFAFAGPAWDEPLRLASLDPRLSGLSERSAAARLRCGLGALFRSSLADATPLLRAIRAHVDGRLLKAVAAGHDEGRRLLVNTTHLDTHEPVTWDLGAIASAASRPVDHGRALRLFRSVLAASASVPGVFPPTPIRWDADRRAELHVDGCVNAPFFLAPRGRSPLAEGEVHLVVNGVLHPQRQVGCQGVIPTLLRALDTSGRAALRSRVAVLELMAERQAIAFTCTSIPDEAPADPYDFGIEQRQRLFALGAAQTFPGQAAAPIPAQPRPARLD